MIGRLRAAAFLALLTAGSPWLGAASGLRFSDVSDEAGLGDFVNLCGAKPGEKGWLNESMGAGAAWLDFDSDGRLDLFVVNGSTYERGNDAGEPNRLYRQSADGHFVDVTASSGVGDRGWGYGATVGDIDNDGHPDLYVTNFAANVLYRNRGDGTFEDITAKAGVANPDWSSSAAFFDMEGDGDLDLYVGNYIESDPTKVPRRGSDAAIALGCHYRGIPVSCGPLRQTGKQDRMYRNDGGGRFTDVTRESGMWLEVPRYALGVVTADFDDDGDQDVYVANDSESNSLWQNDGSGRFSDVGLKRLVALNVDGRAQAGMGTDFGDYDNDGWLDLVVTNFAHDFNTIYHNLGGRLFVDETARTGMLVTHLALSWGTAFHDFDLDSDLDLFIANGHVYPQVDEHDIGTTFRQTNHLFLNENHKFREVAAESGEALQVSRSFRGAAFADYDNDGDVDILLTALGDRLQLLRNDSPRLGRFLKLRLVGKRSNRDAVGARVRVRSGEMRLTRQRKGGGSYLSGSDSRLHFGVGPRQRVERVEIRWPSGVEQLLRDVETDREVVVEEPDAPSK